VSPQLPPAGLSQFCAKAAEPVTRVHINAKMNRERFFYPPTNGAIEYSGKEVWTAPSMKKGYHGGETRQ
jgi:hypothetical protein